MKISNKIFEKCVLSVMVFIMLLGILPFKAADVYADGGLEVSTSSISMSIGDEKLFRIKADNCAASIDIISSDEKIARVSVDSAFLDNESLIVAVNAYKAGDCVITIRVNDAATYDEKHFTAEYTIDVTVDQELGPQQVLYPYANFESGDVSNGSLLRLLCDTPDAVIYYSLNGSDYSQYDDAITLNKSIADEEDKIYVSAYASREGNYTDSETVDYTYHIVESPEDYGEISEEDREIYIDPQEIPKGFWLTGVKDLNYTGKKQTQENIRVYYHTTLLKEKSDYTISYKDNQNAGTATMTVTGKGNYAGSLSKTFAIKAILISPEISLTEIYAYNKSGISVSPKVTYNGKTLKNKTDYVCTILNESGSTVSKLSDPGIYSVRIDGAGNYSFTRSFEVRVMKDTQKLVSKLNITLPSSKYPYEGKEITPVPVVKDGNTVLEPLSDYFEISYQDNINAGTASVIVTAKPDCQQYAGSAIKTFKIDGTSISYAKINGLVSSFAYTGDPITQDLQLAYKDEPLTEGKDYSLVYENNKEVGTATLMIYGLGRFSGSMKKTFKINGVSVSKTSITGIYDKTYTGQSIEQSDLKLTYEGKVLKEGTDYQLAYKNNLKAGTATVTISGLGAYTGSVKKYFKIYQTQLTNKNANVSMASSYDYEKGGVKPEPVIKVGSYTLINGMDYKLSYKNNSKVSDNSGKMAQVIITGKGNYKGTLIREFTIETKDLVKTQVLVKDCSAGLHKVSASITDTNGKSLSALTDYTISKIVYNENVRLSNGTQRYKGESVFITDLVPANTVLKATIKAKGNYTGTVTVLYKTYQKNISSLSATIQAKEYTGEPVYLSKSEIVLKKGTAIIDSSNFDIVSYKNNIAKGNATVVIRGKGNIYGGIKEIKFAIRNKNLSCNLHFDGNGNTSGSMKDQSIGEALPIRSNSFKKTGYIFEGWSLARNGTKVYDDKDLFNYDESCYGKTITLYAVWRMQ